MDFRKALKRFEDRTGKVETSLGEHKKDIEYLMQLDRKVNAMSGEYKEFVSMTTRQFENTHSKYDMGQNKLQAQIDGMKSYEQQMSRIKADLAKTDKLFNDTKAELFKQLSEGKNAMLNA